MKITEPVALKRKSMWLVRLLAYAVSLHGLIVIASTLETQINLRSVRHFIHFNEFVFDIPVLLGLSLLYLGLLLRRRKRTAWVIALMFYAIFLILSLVRLSLAGHWGLAFVVRDIAVPLMLLLTLWLFREDFKVKSDVRSFALSLRFIVLILAVAFAYGVGGFMLLDLRDFHEEITLPEAIHRTIDQFDLTTTHTLVAYTRRAKVFTDSLSLISVGSVMYAGVSLFQPIRARLSSEANQLELAEQILARHQGSSEDFFKLWPHDKLYFFNLQHTAGIAYNVRHGVALVVGDPFGERSAFPRLIANFEEYCQINDWTLAFIHTEPPYRELYSQVGFHLQKIGEEAIVDLEHFDEQIRDNKYFRQIENKFRRQGYTTEMLTPPHNQALLNRLKYISDEWLSLPGRTERRFMLGYFSAEYMQRCQIMVLRDAAGTIQAFINQIPSFDRHEANFDLLRHTKEALGNANDFLLLNLMNAIKDQNFERLNLGLCPLAGLDEHEKERTVIDSALRFVYSNGDRFYSFSGLRRFKAKYEPTWSNRYIVYRGGVRNFTRVVSALNKAMKL